MPRIVKVDLAVILAAGGGARMGAPKGLLDLRGWPLVWHQVQSYRQVANRIAVVVGCRADEHLAQLKGVLPVHNPDWEHTWPADSLHLALRALCPTGPVFVAPVDTPPPTAGTLEALLNAGAPAVPTWQDRDGHPVLIDEGTALAIATEAPAGGLVTLLGSARRVPVEQAGIDSDFDVRADWLRFERSGG